MSGLFYLSIVGTIFAIVAYIMFPIEPGAANGESVRRNTMFLGIGLSVALLGIGIGAVYWAKTLMSNEEIPERRHQTRGTDETRASAPSRSSESATRSPDSGAEPSSAAP